MAEKSGSDARTIQREAAVLAPEHAREERIARGPGRWWHATLVLLLAMLLLGIVPMTLIGEEFGAWRIHLPGTPILAAETPAATPAVDLAVPRAAWVAATTTVLAQPERGAQLATLEAGFPVTLTAHQRAGAGTLWSHIQWAGPTSTTGGMGWVPDSALVAYAGATRPIGDLGALSPALAQTIAPYGSAFAATVYFPNSGQLYQLRADQDFPLGSGFRPILLAAQAASAPAHPRPAVTPSAITSAGNTPDGSTLYIQVGGSSGVTSYLSGAGVVGIRPAIGNWLLTRATPTAMAQFYAALATGEDGATASGSAALLSGLTRLSATDTSRLTGSTPLGAGSFLVESDPVHDNGWTLNTCGVLTLAHGPRIVVAAVILGQPSQAAAAAALDVFYAHLVATLAR